MPKWRLKMRRRQGARCPRPAWLGLQGGAWLPQPLGTGPSRSLGEPPAPRMAPLGAARVPGRLLDSGVPQVRGVHGTKDFSSVFISGFPSDVAHGQTSATWA